MHDRNLNNTTEWLFLNFYYRECELDPVILQLGQDYDNRFYHF